MEIKSQGDEIKLIKAQSFYSLIVTINTNTKWSDNQKGLFKITMIIFTSNGNAIQLMNPNYLPHEYDP